MNKLIFLIVLTSLQAARAEKWEPYVEQRTQGVVVEQAKITIVDANFVDVDVVLSFKELISDSSGRSVGNVHFGEEYWDLTPADSPMPKDEYLILQRLTSQAPKAYFGPGPNVVHLMGQRVRMRERLNPMPVALGNRDPDCRAIQFDESERGPGAVWTYVRGKNSVFSCISSSPAWAIGPRIVGMKTKVSIYQIFDGMNAPALKLVQVDEKLNLIGEPLCSGDPGPTYNAFRCGFELTPAKIGALRVAVIDPAMKPMGMAPVAVIEVQTEEQGKVAKAAEGEKNKVDAKKRDEDRKTESVRAEAAKVKASEQNSIWGKVKRMISSLFGASQAELESELLPLKEKMRFYSDGKGGVLAFVTVPRNATGVSSVLSRETFFWGDGKGFQLLRTSEASSSGDHWTHVGLSTGEPGESTDNTKKGFYNSDGKIVLRCGGSYSDLTKVSDRKSVV